MLPRTIESLPQTCGWRLAIKLHSTCVDILKIEKTSGQGRTTIHLIGRCQSEHLEELKTQLQTNGARFAFDLQQVTLVDLDVVQFLAQCEAVGVKIVHCPPYIREWILRERSGA
jgi:hypothetical protein